MFVADVKCSQATRETVPNLRTGSAKASVSKAVVRTRHRTRYLCVLMSYPNYKVSIAANLTDDKTHNIA